MWNVKKFELGAGPLLASIDSRWDLQTMQRPWPSDQESQFPPPSPCSKAPKLVLGLVELHSEEKGPSLLAVLNPSCPLCMHTCTEDMNLNYNGNCCINYCMWCVTSTAKIGTVFGLSNEFR